MMMTMATMITKAGTTLLFLLLWSGTARAAVPGCECPASDCTDGSFVLSSGACQGATFRAADLIDLNSTDPICDVVDASDEFQMEFGNTSEPFFFTTGGGTTGPWQPSNAVYARVGPGTCDVAIAAQSLCLEETTTTDDIPATGINFAATSELSPSTCVQYFTSPAQDNSTVFKLSLRCKGYFALQTGETMYGMESIVLTEPVVTDTDLCDAESTPPAPILTDQDWQDDVPGRQYMCTETVIDGETHYVFLLTLGNQPCSEPPAPEPSTSGAVSTSFTALSFTAWLVSAAMAF